MGMKKLGMVLVVEPSQPGTLCRLVESSGSADVIRTARSLAEGFTALHERPADAVVVDLGVPDADGIGGLRAVRAMIGRAPLIAIVDDPLVGEAAMQEGRADDSLSRDSVNAAALGRAIRYADHRRRATAELGASEARNGRLAAIIEAADDLVLLIDAAERVFFMNTAAHRFLGDPDLSALPSLRASAVFATSDNEDFWYSVLPDLVLDGSWRGDLHLVNVHGVPIRHAVTLMHHEKSDHDDQAYFSVVCHDLSALAAAAEKEHMQRLVEAKDQFVATVSHELRTPLTAVLGYAEMLCGGAFGDDPEGHDEAARLVFSQAQEVSDIIEDLIIGARADLGTVSVDPQEMHLSVQVASVCEPLQRDLAKELVVASSPALVFADPLRTRQIIRNLLTNAVRYGGEIVRIETVQEGETVTLVVSDNGSGISEQNRQVVFEPFHSTGGPSDAVGLGLAVSRRLARMMGGELTYDYIDGWSELRLTLPTPRAATQSVECRGT